MITIIRRLLLFFLFLYLVFFVFVALAHDAPEGWTYPTGCCSGVDCRPVNSTESPYQSAVKVLERPEGYVISTTGEIIPYNDTKVRISKDIYYHWCSVNGLDTGATHCLFVPPRGF